MKNYDIVITLRNGSCVIWGENEYDDYAYEGSVFVVIRDGEWIGIYNMDHVVSIEVGFSGNEELVNESN